MTGLCPLNLKSTMKVRSDLSYTDQFRNFCIVWKDDTGNFYSECYRQTLGNWKRPIIDFWEKVP